MEHKKEAKFYTKNENLSVSCNLCPHNCLIKNGNKGFCGVREVVDGSLYTNNWAKISSLAMDPIEKKPLFNYYPSSMILSVGTIGCNLKCPFCQNWQISQNCDISTKKILPNQLVEIAVRENSLGIAYTYNEPTIWIEYILETAKHTQKYNLKNIMVTNGQINSEPLEELLPFVDAMNVDLKSFSEMTYKKKLYGDLKATLKTIEIVNSSRTHLELTTLVVTGINDSIEEMEEIINYIANLNDEIPWHISRYFPNYEYNEKATDLDFIEEIYNIASKKLKYVYLGNVNKHISFENSFCPHCGEVLISRTRYNVKNINIKDGKCNFCGKNVAIIS